MELKLRLSALHADIMRMNAELSDTGVLEFSEKFQLQYPDIAKQSMELFSARRNKLVNDLATKEALAKQKNMS